MTPSTQGNEVARREVAVLEARFEACRARADERWAYIEQRLENIEGRLSDMRKAELDIWTKVFLGLLAIVGSLVTAVVSHYLG